MQKKIAIGGDFYSIREVKTADLQLFDLIRDHKSIFIVKFLILVMGPFPLCWLISPLWMDQYFQFSQMTFWDNFYKPVFKKKI